jgi:hypothetical protein
MKKTVLVFAMVLFVSVPVFAEQTSSTQWDSQGIGCISGDDVNEFLNETGVLNHKHEVREEKKLQYGVGMDAVLWQNQKENPVFEEVTAEVRYTIDKDTDLDEGKTTGYLVARVNLFNLFKSK